MIFVCVASSNNADTVGLLLWKVRKVFDDFPREYHLLVADDASTDETANVLQPYEDALPLSVIRHADAKGYAATIEQLIVEALDRSDRPRRDFAIMLPADFSVSPEVIPDLIKRLESGVDVVVAERPTAHERLGMRLVRRTAARLLRPGLKLDAFHDVMSGVYAFRLITLRNVIKQRGSPLLDCDGVPANAELVARAALGARQIAATPVPVRAGAPTPDGRPFALAVQLYRAGRRLNVPAPSTTVQRVS